jgi:predicted CXXCH cytochrome family protein
VGYAAQLENKDAFCASCHTEPESQFVNLAQSVPVDLASAHAAKGVECIQCHSGRGTVGRVTAMASVALPDLIAFRLGHYAQPAVTTKPMGDDHCLKCHASVTQNRDFNNHFHAFLPLWQARDPQHAATCESCHVSHVTGGDPQTAFLVEATTVAVCQRCHAFAGG